MKKCPICGNSNFDTDTSCDRCKAPLPTPTQTFTAQPQFTYSAPPQQQPYYTNRAPSTLSIVAKVFMLLNTSIYWISFITTLVLWAISLSTNVDEFAVLMLICMISSLIYAIVATIITKSYFEKKRNGWHISIRFKIASCLFFGLITLILMILDDN